MKVITAPEAFDIRNPDGPNDMRVFLAGSIDQDAAPVWQQHVIASLKWLPLVIYNPRRKAWDSSWTNTIENKDFRKQVNWELTAMADADLVAYYFAPGTLAPITLLEFGLHIRTGNMQAKEFKQMVVCCPEGYWRKGNVDIMCQRYSIEQVPDLEALIETIGAKAKQ